MMAYRAGSPNWTISATVLSGSIAALDGFRNWLVREAVTHFEHLGDVAAEGRP